MSSEEYQELGKRYYKFKEYQKAVEAFTKGIETTPTLSLFDHRAAAYDRLEDYASAVKDGREMIKADKQDVKGYLRTASILEKMKKPETALAIYKYGMKNVPVSDKNFKLLQQLHDKMTRRLSPATSVDPLTVLPVELAEMILEYLAFRNLVNCMRVNRGWRDCIGKRPRLWMHLNLAGARRPVPRKFVDKAVRRSENRLRRITIHQFEHVDMLINIAKACKNLNHVEFISLPHAMASALIDMVKHAPKLERLLIRPQITMDTAVSILNAHLRLTEVTFLDVRASRHPVQWEGPFPTLTSLVMNMGRAPLPAPSFLHDLLLLTPQLQTLHITDPGSVYTRLAHVTALPLVTLVVKVVNADIPVLPPTLETVSLEFLSGHCLSDETTRTLLASKLALLQHLTLMDVNNLSPDRMEQLLDLYTDQDGQIRSLEHARPLASLTIRGLLADHAHGTDTLFKRSPTGSVPLLTRSPRILTPALQHLGLANMYVDDDEMDALLTHHQTGLVSIDLSFTRITGASIKMLVDRLPTLKTICADHCERIGGRDAIEYARRKGVSVSCSMNEGKGSRKVRYG
ncbi:hypothetical protein ACEQ8H_001687 [Pleosporales sp. CAS-2024a]